jgi:hypothetical protein
MDALMIIGICGWAVLSGFASYKMAAGKSRSIRLWTSIGLLFNVPGMLLVAFLPVNEQKSAAGSVVVEMTQPQAPSSAIAA